MTERAVRAVWLCFLTRRLLPLLDGDGAADPAVDRSGRADAAEVVDPGLRRGLAKWG